MRLVIGIMNDLKPIIQYDNKSTPLVSICSITYNHEKYIRQCLDGFLMQKTKFQVEIIIHDDASTDKTADIIREYSENYPNKLITIFQNENKYSQGIKSKRKSL